MYVRVVRFTDVDPEHMRQMLAEVEGSGEPPVDMEVLPKAVQVLHDEGQGTSVVLQFFDTAEDMAAAESAFDSMDPSDTPGTRASIDRCELKAEIKPG